MQEFVANYYIGKPSVGKAGQRKNGTVSCILWMYIHKEGRQYTVWMTGGYLHTAASLAAAKRFILSYALGYLEALKQKAYAELCRCSTAAQVLLDSGLRGLKTFEGKYKSC